MSNATSRARVCAWAKVLSGVTVLALIGWRVGAGPFVDGIRAVDAGSVVLALGIGMITTAAAAWRWTSVAAGLGVAVPIGPAISAYYRAQFLNTMLPGGVLGDVDRGVRHGRDAGAVGRALRAVVWERSSGQAVQVAATVVVLLLLPSPIDVSVPVGMMIMVAAVVGWGLSPKPWSRASGDPGRYGRCGRGGRSGVLRTTSPTQPLAFRSSRSGPGFGKQALGLLARVQVVRADLRVMLSGRVWPRVLLPSLVVVAGHTTTYLVAARAVGTVAPTVQLVPLALLALVAMAVPLNVGGWGPREGVAAWSFAAVGLGADAGVATATAYGVIVFAASLPGAAVLALDGLRRVPLRLGSSPRRLRTTLGLED